MRNFILGLLVSGWLLVAAWLGELVAPTYNPMDQRHFPCEEDEALVYGPQFGPAHTGCVTLER